MTKYIHIISAAIAFLCLSSCQQNDDVLVGANERFRIKAYVGESTYSRAVPREDDGFSVSGFEHDDLAGFFSQSGNRNDSNNGFDNSLMTFENGYFAGDEEMSVDINRMGKTLLYYPYSPESWGRQTVRDTPFSEEVKDVLFSLTVGNPEGNESALVARFSHLFAMLEITGGYGFENFHLEDVSVTLSEPVETVEFRRTANPDDKYGYWVCLNGEYKDNGTKPDESFATVVGHYDSNELRQKYYVIVPTDGSISVKTINVCDDSGKRHKIKCNLAVKSGKRYPLTLELNELIPSIYLHDITPWDSGTDLNANKPKGIGSPSDMETWLEEYNKANPREDILLNYGDKVRMTDAQGAFTGEEYWRFYLIADIDLSHMSDETAHLVNTLKDEFDGNGYTITGLSFKNQANAALFNVIDGTHACVKNLSVDNLLVNTTGSAPVGALVTEFRSGLIENCSFTNLSLHAINSRVGALAGTISGNGAIVRKCKFSGAIFGKSTIGKIAGDGVVSDDVRKGCDTSNVMFGNT